MSRLYYDFHIHTALSPCADDDMTPCNIVNMATIIGLDAIAITDHNSIRNAESAMRYAAANTDLIVLPGMEIETMEEVHMIALFSDVDAARLAYESIRDAMPHFENRRDIYGNQLLFDENDACVGEEPVMLLSSCMLSVDEVVELAYACGGVCYPAHIDRSSNSILSNLGFIADELPITCVEVSKRAPDPVQYCANKGVNPRYRIMRSSDSHSLDMLSEPINVIDVDEPTARCVIDALRGII